MKSRKTKKKMRKEIHEAEEIKRKKGKTEKKKQNILNPAYNPSSKPQ